MSFTVINSRSNYNFKLANEQFFGGTQGFTQFGKTGSLRKSGLINQWGYGQGKRGFWRNGLSHGTVLLWTG